MLNLKVENINFDVTPVISNYLIRMQNHCTFKENTTESWVVILVLNQSLLCSMAIPGYYLPVLLRICRINGIWRQDFGVRDHSVQNFHFDVFAIYRESSKNKIPEGNIGKSLLKKTCIGILNWKYQFSVQIFPSIQSGRLSFSFGYNLW